MIRHSAKEKQLLRAAKVAKKNHGLEVVAKKVARQVEMESMEPLTLCRTVCLLLRLSASILVTPFLIAYWFICLCMKLASVNHDRLQQFDDPVECAERLLGDVSDIQDGEGTTGILAFATGDPGRLDDKLEELVSTWMLKGNKMPKFKEPKWWSKLRQCEKGHVWRWTPDQAVSDFWGTLTTEQQDAIVDIESQESKDEVLSRWRRGQLHCCSGKFSDLKVDDHLRDVHTLALFKHLFILSVSKNIPMVVNMRILFIVSAKILTVLADVSILSDYISDDYLWPGNDGWAEHVDREHGRLLCMVEMLRLFEERLITRLCEGDGSQLQIADQIPEDCPPEENGPPASTIDEDDPSYKTLLALEAPPLAQSAPRCAEGNARETRARNAEERKRERRDKKIKAMMQERMLAQQKALLKNPDEGMSVLKRLLAKMEEQLRGRQTVS